MLSDVENVEAFEAEANLSALLERVEMGETIVITRLGKPIASLDPEAELFHSVEEAIQELRNFRQTHPVTRSEVKVIIQDGRKY